MAHLTVPTVDNHPGYNWEESSKEREEEDTNFQETAHSQKN